MSWTAPRTWVNGEVPTDSIFNTHLRDELAWLGTDGPYCRAFASAAQSIATGTTPILITLNNERYDNASMHDNVTNNSRITIPAGGAGKYIFGASVSFGLSATGFRQSRIRQTGTTALIVDSRPADASTGSEQNPTDWYSLAAADYLELLCTQNSGGALNAGGTPGPGAELWAAWYRN